MELEMYATHMVDSSILPDAPYIVDCGSCVGEFVDEIKAIRPRATFSTIEPNHYNIETLKEKYDNDPLVEIIHGAVSTSSDRSVWFHSPPRLHVRKGRGLGNIIAPYGNRTPEMYAVPVINLCTFIDKRVDVLKMDIEGAELGLFQDIFFLDFLEKNVMQVTMETHKPAEKIMVPKVLENLGFSVTLQGYEPERAALGGEVHGYNSSRK